MTRSLILPFSIMWSSHEATIPLKHMLGGTCIELSNLIVSGVNFTNYWQNYILQSSMYYVYIHLIREKRLLLPNSHLFKMQGCSLQRSFCLGISKGHFDCQYLIYYTVRDYEIDIIWKCTQIDSILMNMYYSTWIHVNICVLYNLQLIRLIV